MSQNRNGSTYLVVMSVGILVSVIAAGSIAVSTSIRRQSQLDRDSAVAGLLSRSCVDMAINEMETTPNWRTQLISRQFVSQEPAVQLNQGEMNWSLWDLKDYSISDNPEDFVYVICDGVHGTATKRIAYWAIPSGRPLDVLRLAAHSSRDLTTNDAVIVGNGPLSTDANLVVTSADVRGSAEFSTADVQSNVSGWKVSGAGNKVLPSRLVATVYESLASVIDFNSLSSPGQIRNEYVGPERNPSAEMPLNANGVYLVSVPANSTLTIENAMISGTLIVRLANKNSKLFIGNGVVWKPNQRCFPALIVDAKTDDDTEVTITSAGTFIPSASPTPVQLDPQTTNNFGYPSGVLTQPASLQGVFHVIRNARFGNDSPTTVIATNPIVGSIIVDGPLEIGGSSHLVADPRLLSNPPIGYTNAIELDQRLTNRDFDNGMTMWQTFPQNRFAAGPKVDWALEGTNRFARIYDRNSPLDGLCQDITCWVQSHQTYALSFSAKTELYEENLRVCMEIETDSGIQRLVNSVAVGSTWASHSMSFSPIWTGTLIRARLLFSSTESSQSFSIDSVTIPDQRTNKTSDLYVVPTSFGYTQAF